LALALARYGYVVTRQKGAHIRLTTQIPSQHHITIPNHDPLRIGTLAAILDAVADHVGISRNELLQQIS
jgi:predicted RNA binding protein YcfA (HicA-like mRNA interferase family)